MSITSWELITCLWHATFGYQWPAPARQSAFCPHLRIDCARLNDVKLLILKVDINIVTFTFFHWTKFIDSSWIFLGANYVMWYDAGQCMEEDNIFVSPALHCLCRLKRLDLQVSARSGWDDAACFSRQSCESFSWLAINSQTCMSGGYNKPLLPNWASSLYSSLCCHPIKL